MDIRIGVTNAIREIEIEVDDKIDREELKDHVESRLKEPSSVLWIVDRRGREVAVPSGNVAYVEIGTPTDQRTIGFST